MTTADKIRRFMAKGVRPVEIAAKLGVNIKRVHKIKWQDKKKAEKEKPKITRKSPVPDPKAKAWSKQNPWFGKDEEQTLKALQLHELLVQEGVDPKSDEYWRRVDLGMKKDNVNHPAHYTTGGIETLDFIEAKNLNYRLGNVVKYVSRAGLKNDALEDLKKAEFYLKREIAARERA